MRIPAPSYQPRLISGGVHRDVRGTVAFCNDFDMCDVRRFYTIEFAAGQPFRGWIGHQFEHKWFWPMVGTTVILVVRVDDFEHPSAQLPVESFELTADDPAVLALPAGYAIGMRAAASRTNVMVFSDKTLEESTSDQWRWPVTMWNN